MSRRDWATLNTSQLWKLNAFKPQLSTCRISNICSKKWKCFSVNWITQFDILLLPTFFNRTLLCRYFLQKFQKSSFPSTFNLEYFKLKNLRPECTFRRTELHFWVDSAIFLSLSAFLSLFFRFFRKNARRHFCLAYYVVRGVPDR